MVPCSKFRQIKLLILLTPSDSFDDFPSASGGLYSSMIVSGNMIKGIQQFY